MKFPHFTYHLSPLSPNLKLKYLKKDSGRKTSQKENHSIKHNNTISDTNRSWFGLYIAGSSKEFSKRLKNENKLVKDFYFYYRLCYDAWRDCKKCVFLELHLLKALQSTHFYFQEETGKKEIGKTALLVFHHVYLSSFYFVCKKR